VNARQARQHTLAPGDQIEARVTSGHCICLTRRYDGQDYRVTVMLLDRHVELPRHFPTEALARQHAYGVTRDYRPTGTPVATTIRRTAALAA
jgi:hypothetical protein